jgi:hypothetical protein
MRVERRCVIDTDRETVWRMVSDPDCYVVHAESRALGDDHRGPGAHWCPLHRALEDRLGPLGGVIEVVEFDEPRDLA